jgi:uncharacterized membrane protein YgdD (TMEM256/DUF423 family)
MNGWLVASGASGFMAVALGAFGAHGLASRLGALAEGERRLGWWETAAHYHLLHALALGLVALLSLRFPQVRVSGYAFLLGTLLFSGSLYVMALGGPRWLGAVTPLGGLSFLAGWAALAWAGLAR